MANEEEATNATNPHSEKSLLNIAIFLFVGVELLDFGGPGEVLSVAGRVEGSPIKTNVYTVSADGEPIVSQDFVKVLPSFSIANCPKPDILVLPGGDTRESLKNQAVIDWITGHEQEGGTALSVCTGAFLLAEAGVLDGATATTWYGALDRLAKRAPRTKVLSDVRFVDNGRLITTAGVSAGIDGALHLVEKVFGSETAAKTAEYMEYDYWQPGRGHIAAND